MVALREPLEVRYIVEHYNRGLITLQYFPTWEAADAWRAKSGTRGYVTALSLYREETP
jgi:hypothetical protein